MSSKSKVGASLRALRLHAGVPLERLAARAGTSARALDAIERGELVPERTLVRRITAAITEELAEQEARDDD